MSYGLFAVAILFVAYGLMSKRLSTTAVTGPMLFVTAGFLVGSSGLGVIDADLERLSQVPNWVLTRSVHETDEMNVEELHTRVRSKPPHAVCVM